jgi:hypothetical protein
MRRLVASLIVVSAMLTLVAPAQADNLIFQVPDWNQPAPAGYPNWCSPTAGANIMGYWDDVQGCDQLTDNQWFNASPAYANNAGTWQQGLYQDGMVEMGWFMQTDGWVPPPAQFPPGWNGTTLNKILPGLLGYAHTAWVDPGVTAIAKLAFPQTAGFTQAKGDAGIDPIVMWNTYTSQIDLGHPVEMSFDRWVDDPNGITYTVKDQIVDEYNWDEYPNSEGGHSVVGVGYFIDANQTNWFVCQDGWGTTPQYVAVPMDYTKWWQNDYITTVPEPTTFVLLIVGTVSVLIYGWRRRRTV